MTQEELQLRVKKPGEYFLIYSGDKDFFNAGTAICTVTEDSFPLTGCGMTLHIICKDLSRTKTLQHRAFWIEDDCIKAIAPISDVLKGLVE